jgi:hypothetical protein
MSLPSGLIFFLDFTLDRTRLGSEIGESVYGGGVVASGLTGGVSLSGDEAEDSFYALNNGYSSPTGSSTSLTVPVVRASGTVGDPSSWSGATTVFDGSTWASHGDSLVRYDADLSGTNVAVGTVLLSDFTSDTAGVGGQLNVKDYITITYTNVSSGSQVRRLTRDCPLTVAAGGTPTLLYIINAATGSESTDELATDLALWDHANWAIYDNFDPGGSLGSVVGNIAWGLENNPDIPEIDIKVDSVAVTADTKKLKAKWTPELAQDLNAYHNLDAEVELTSILSEHIALEIDQEILEDLVMGAKAATYYWSRRPGKFVNRDTGTTIGTTSGFPDFTGNVSEWYETLCETINDVSAQIHRKTLRGGANFVVVSPEVANILEFTAGFRGTVTHDDDRGTVGAVKVGNLSKKWDVYVDPYFPRNVVLVGRKGSSFLESGYVYAPYVPLQMTPTIFGVEDFVPRKGVMTRYAKKMVRPDMYGLVIVEDLLG